jgi:hypothetical protein
MKRPGQAVRLVLSAPKNWGHPSSLDLQGLHYRMLTSNEPRL